MNGSSLKKPSPTTNFENILALRPPIGGWTPFSSIDDPGYLSTVLFLEGCPWRCGYCHNRHLWNHRAQTDIHQLRAFVSHLENRRGLLDSVVISGGEPTAFQQLPELADSLRSHYRVALHTGGAETETFAQALPFINWVGFDFKTTWDNYSQLTRNNQSGTSGQRSLECLLASQTPYEIRTTITPTHHTQEILLNMLDQLIALDIKTWFLQEGRQSSRKRMEELDELLNDAFIDQLRNRADDSKIKINMRHADGSQSTLTHSEQRLGYSSDRS